MDNQNSGQENGMLARGVWLFLLITFGWSWGLAAGICQSGRDYSIALLVLYMAGPGVAAFVCALLYDRHRFFAALGLSSNPFNRWLFIAFLAPFLIVGFAFLATHYIGGREILTLEEAFLIQFKNAGIDPEELPLSVQQIAWLQIISLPVVAGVINTAFMMVTEEVGWRGWLWDRWSHMPFWRHAMLTGFIWGAWHAPIVALGYNYPGLPVWGPVIFIGWVMFMTPIIALIREKGGSMVHGAMFHGVFNGVAPITVIMLADPSMPWRGAIGLGGFAALALGIGVVIAYRAVTKIPHQ